MMPLSRNVSIAVVCSIESKKITDTFFFACVEQNPTLVHNPLARDDLKFQHLIFVFVHQPTIMFCS